MFTRVQAANSPLAIRQFVRRPLFINVAATIRGEGVDMKLGLINSAWAQAGRDTAWGIQKTRELGFDTIDIFADPLDLDVREKSRIKRECDRLGLPIVSIACVAVGLVDF